ncbi:hypothetical protein P5V15_012254 [Pogonomyrmex californicus]
MENEEIVQLRERKEELFKKIIHLRDTFKNQEENGHQGSSINFNITLFSYSEDQQLLESISSKYNAKLCKVTSQAAGITFENINKNWLQDDVYMYVGKVITKTVSFNVELTVFSKNLNDFKVENILCHFIDVPDCYMLEISPWFQKITNMKNFSLLMSALSDYNENNIFRSKILHSLELKKYVSMEQYTQDNGGILVHVHSPVDTEKIYVIFQWAMKFLELTWCIEHFFTVKSTDIGIEFSEKNCTLLKEFCNIGLTKNDFVDLWNKLCIAIDTYHEKKMADKTDYFET